MPSVPSSDQGPHDDLSLSFPFSSAVGPDTHSTSLATRSRHCNQHRQYHTRRDTYSYAYSSWNRFKSSSDHSETSARFCCDTAVAVRQLQTPAPAFIKAQQTSPLEPRLSMERPSSMASFDEAADTTPELSIASSRTSATSSCSSSLRSVSFPDDEARDTVDFEHITLSDDSRCITPMRRPTLRSSKSAGSPLSPRMGVSHDVLRTTASRNHHARSLRQPAPRRHNGDRPSSSSPSLSPPSASSIRTFSSHRSSSSPAQSSPHSPLSPRSDNAPMLPRRPSRQPNAKRKTAKELEAEYDDLDEDLPEDAIVYNVPCLRPVDYRTPQKTHARALKSSPTSPRRTSPERGDLKERSPPIQKTKSWDEVMRDLSQDARKLTTALESHHDHSPSVKPPSPTRSMSKHASRPALHVSATTSNVPQLTVATASSAIEPAPVRPAFPASRRAHTATLPTIQTLSPAQDPLGSPSKEKERWLTRTRPSWLPPKSVKEDRRHLREWEKMMRRTGASTADVAVQ